MDCSTHSRSNKSSPELSLIPNPLITIELSHPPDQIEDGEINPTLVGSHSSFLNPDPISRLAPHVSTATDAGDFSAEPCNAIVLADADPAVVSKKKKKKKKAKARSAEMVRVSSMTIPDYVHKRNEVKKARRTYESLALLAGCDEDRPPHPGAKGGPTARTAAALMKSRGLWLNRDRRIVGTIPGINIGDVFFFRIELCVVGLHGQNQAGIDYVPAARTGSGDPIATSIVVSGGYEDDDDGGDELVYTGEGGRERNAMRQNAHQRLEGANLAMQKSMENGIEVRVIRGMQCTESPTGRVYVYDGLYKIVECWLSVGKSGFWVHKNKLVRIQGQEEMGSSVLKLAKKLKANPLSVRPAGYLSLDISGSKEKVPVLLFNDVDGDQDPLFYEYLVSPVYLPFILRGGSHGGCQCVSNCSENCPCAQRNGGKFAYDMNGILLRGKPLIYECGRWCWCPPNCHNRVSQKGVKHQLEVFRSEETGWGVRSLDLIRAGSFVCELSGVILTEQQQSEVAASMDSFAVICPGKFPATWKEWGDIGDVFPEYVTADYLPLPNMRFSLDVSKGRNVGCYLSHSCSPNVFVQPVLFDHYNESYPHLMIFTMENIPPLREMSIDYGV